MAAAPDLFVRGFAPTTMVQKAGTGPCRYGRRMRNGHKECETEIRFKTPVMTRGKSRHDSNQLRISGLGGTTVIVSMLDSGVWTLSLSLHLPAPISCRAIIAGVQSRRDFEKHSRKKKPTLGCVTMDRHGRQKQRSRLMWWAGVVGPPPAYFWPRIPASCRPNAQPAS